MDFGIALVEVDVAALQAEREQQQASAGASRVNSQGGLPTIRQNLNFLGKSEGSIDDAILLIRAFCLVALVVTLLLHESRRSSIFAL